MTSEDINNLVDKLTDKECWDIAEIAYELYDAANGSDAAYGRGFKEALKVRLLRPIIESRLDDK